jgi:hypothetical protein
MTPVKLFLASSPFCRPRPPPQVVATPPYAKTFEDTLKEVKLNLESQKEAETLGLPIIPFNFDYLAMKGGASATKATPSSEGLLVTPTNAKRSEGAHRRLLFEATPTLPPPVGFEATITNIPWYEATPPRTPTSIDEDHFLKVIKATPTNRPQLRPHFATEGPQHRRRFEATPTFGYATPNLKSVTAPRFNSSSAHQELNRERYFHGHAYFGDDVLIATPMVVRALATPSGRRRLLSQPRHCGSCTCNQESRREMIDNIKVQPVLPSSCLKLISSTTNNINNNSSEDYVKMSSAKLV